MPVIDNATNKLVRLRVATEVAFRRAMDWTEEDFRSEFQTKKWDWPNRTFRNNDTVVTSPRDIVDLGALLKSQTRDNISEYHTTFTWTGNEDGSYALEVHDGYVTRDGQRVLSRPFTRDTIAKLDKVIEGLFVQEVKNG